MGKNKIRPKPLDPEPEPELASLFSGKPLPEERVKEAKPSPEEEARKERRRKARAKFLAALDGSVLFDKGIQAYWGQILFVFFLALLLISGNYLTEAVVRESAGIKDQLQDLHFRQISSKAEWMRLSRQSSVARLLDSTGVKESVVPPYVIRYTPEMKKGAKEEAGRRSKNRKR